MQANELEDARRGRPARRLGREISRHQPGAESGAGEGSGDDGCDDERPHERADPLRGSHTPSWPARETQAR